VVDPFVQEEMDRYGGRLAVHYQTPLIENDAVYMEVKTGHWSQDWSTQSWSESAMKWTDGQLVTAWSYPSEWVPPPPGPDRGWEPEFQPAAVAGYLYLPGPRGSVDKVAAATGWRTARIAPFHDRADVYVAGPLVAASDGRIYYTVVSVAAKPGGSPERGWLVRVDPSGHAVVKSFASLFRSAVTCDSTACRSLRPALNAAVAIGPDGTVFAVGRADADPEYWSIAALDGELKAKWAWAAWTTGSDISTDYRVVDDSSASPVALPDGGVLFGVASQSNVGGHLLRFDANGHLSVSYDYGWDATPAVTRRGATYSIVLKDNTLRSGHTSLVQLTPGLRPEWRFMACVDPASGCDPAREWCTTSVAIDGAGTVIGTNEDGYLYEVNGGRLLGKVSLGARVVEAYTPVAIGPDGRIYAQVGGHMGVYGS